MDMDMDMDVRPGKLKVNPPEVLKASRRRIREMWRMEKSSEADLVYIDCFCRIVDLKLSPGWEERYSRLQAESARVLRTKDLDRVGRPKIDPHLLDLTLVTIEMIGAIPGHPFWPESRLLRTLRIAAESDQNMQVMQKLLLD